MTLGRGTGSKDGGGGSDALDGGGARADLGSSDGGLDASVDLSPPPPPIDPDVKAKLEALEAQNDLFLDQIGNRQTVLKNAIITVGTVLAGGGNPTSASVRELFRATGEMVVSQLLKHEGSVHSVNYSADGKRLVTACSDGTARIYDTATMQVLQTLKGHTQEVTHAAFSTDGKRVVTASADRTARIWSVRDGSPVGSPLAQSEAVRWADFLGDGRWVVTRTATGRVQVWQTADGVPVGVSLVLLY